MQPSGALIWSGKGSLAMSYELKMKLLMHLVCIVQWGVFALIHWEMLGKGKYSKSYLVREKFTNFICVLKQISKEIIRKNGIL